MKVYLTGLSDALIFLTCLYGEMKKEDLLTENIPGRKEYTENYLKRTLSETVKIQELKYARNKSDGTYIRLGFPKGMVRAMCLSQELFWHFEMLAGDEQNRYRGSAPVQHRRRNLSKICSMIYCTGTPVDFFYHEFIDTFLGESIKCEAAGLRKKTIFDDDGKRLSAREILSRLSPDEDMFFTNKALLGRAGEDMAGITTSSRYYGMLLKNKSAFLVYYIDETRYRWNRESEAQQKNRISGYLKNTFGEERFRDPSAILFIKDPEIYNAVLNPRYNTVAPVRPNLVFEKSYLLPITKSYGNLLQLILLSDGDRKLSQKILKEAYKEGAAFDGISQGIKIFSLLLSEESKMLLAKEYSKKEPVILLIHPWQEEAFKNFFKTNAEFITVTEEEFNFYADEIIMEG